MTEQEALDAARAEPPLLDAYGHLNWAVGNDDWIACLDARVNGDGIEYHVVVDCESGGFTDTIERNIVPFAQVANLRQMPDYWADVCREHYAHSRKRSHRVGVRALNHVRKSWNAYLDQLVKLGPCASSPLHYCGVCDECLTPGPDPIRDGWIGSDGRP